MQISTGHPRNGAASVGLGNGVALDDIESPFLSPSRSLRILRGECDIVVSASSRSELYWLNTLDT